MTPRELLDSLRRALLRGELGAWITDHATAGDPVPAAWAACDDDGVMLWFLGHLGHPAHREFDATCSPACEVDVCADCATAIRAALPVLTLGEVAAGRVALEVS